MVKFLVNFPDSETTRTPNTSVAGPETPLDPDRWTILPKLTVSCNRLVASATPQLRLPVRVCSGVCVTSPILLYAGTSALRRLYKHIFPLELITQKMKHSNTYLHHLHKAAPKRWNFRSTLRIVYLERKTFSHEVSREDRRVHSTITSAT